MKNLISVFFLLVCLTSCCRSGYIDDMGRCICSFWGSSDDSRQVHTRDEFMCYEGDYIPLEDDDLSTDLAMTNALFEQADQSPGDPGSAIPGIEGFKDPAAVAELADLFKKIHFPYNSSLIKGQENLQIVRAIANHMKKNKGLYLFVEGHCDERGAEAYNLALGSRRSNTVRSLLVNEGVDPNQVFTISYGKERPISLGHDEEAWWENRRAEFKVYQR